MRLLLHSAWPEWRFTGYGPQPVTAAQVIHDGGRRGGRALAARVAVEVAALRGEHVHLSGRDGVWCVTAHGAGFLYAKLPAA